MFSIIHCELIEGFTVQALNIFETSLRRGKFDESRVYDIKIVFLDLFIILIVSFAYEDLAFRLPDGSLMEITKVYALDAVFDTLDDVPEDVIHKYMSTFVYTFSQIP